MDLLMTKPKDDRKTALKMQIQGISSIIFIQPLVLW
jgi:hypothetical protein